MKRFLDSAWFNFTRLFQWHRVAGIATLTVGAWVLIARFSQVDVGWLFPKEDSPAKPRFQWPDLPGFSVATRAPGPGDKTLETVFTVPTRQLTPRELSPLPPQRQEIALPPSSPPPAQ